MFQVERAYHMHATGDYISGGSNFSASKWLPTTVLYLSKVKKGLTSNDWTAIFQALHRLKDSDARAEQVQIGAPLANDDHEGLLPPDPPTPPALD